MRILDVPPSVVNIEKREREERGREREEKRK
jgi:hypothetical protein